MIDHFRHLTFTSPNCLGNNSDELLRAVDDDLFDGFEKSLELEHLGVRQSKYATFIDYSARLHDISDRFFFWRSIGTIRDMMDP